MREICQSGSMSGNRNQGQVKPDCGGRSESPTQQPPGDYSYCACSRLYSLSAGVGAELGESRFAATAGASSLDRAGAHANNEPVAGRRSR
jgi:hypothetical protein